MNERPTIKVSVYVAGQEHPAYTSDGHLTTVAEAQEFVRRAYQEPHMETIIGAQTEAQMDNTITRIDILLVYDGFSNP